jgi:dTMP kinase
LLDADPGTLSGSKAVALEDQWRVQQLLTEMAAADPDRYVVVDADGTEEEVGERVRTAVRAVLIGRRSGLAPTEATHQTGATGTETTPQAREATEVEAPYAKVETT